MNERPKTLIPGDLPRHWRERAEMLRDYGAGEPARLWQIAADELDAAMQAQSDTTLNLREAARLSGYHQAHLGQLVRTGKIPNVGRTNAPRIRVGDLPIKTPGGRGRPTTPIDPEPAPNERPPIRPRSFNERRAR
jgi:hypothetical protein